MANRRFLTRAGFAASACAALSLAHVLLTSKQGAALLLYCCVGIVLGYRRAVMVTQVLAGENAEVNRDKASENPALRAEAFRYESSVRAWAARCPETAHHIRWMMPAASAILWPYFEWVLPKRSPNKGVVDDW